MLNKHRHKDKIASTTKIVDNDLPFSYRNRVNISSKFFKLDGN